MQATNTNGKQMDDAQKAQQEFQLSKDELVELVQAYKSRVYDEEILGCQNLGMIEGISNKLKVDVSTGISGDTFPARTAQFGNNYRAPLKAKTFCKIFFEALDDFMLKVLIVAATGSLIFEYIGADSDHYATAWFDGAAIYLAVLIVSGFSALVDWSKEKEFVKRAQQDEDDKIVTVTRHQGDQVTQKIHVNYLHVGDVMHLRYGMMIPVDGLVISENQLTTDEAAMTGESDERRKETIESCLKARAEKGDIDYKKVEKTDSHDLPSPLLLSGTSVASGDGKMLVIMVGDFSALGEIMRKLEVRPQATPLQEKLEIIATEIGKIGTYAALLTIHVLLFRYFLDGLLKRNIDLFGGEDKEDRPFAKNFKLWVDYIVIGVAVIVVAVPEGLPLAVMISLAYSQGKMMKDQNYVKKLAACEIMGGATNICSDKTGTLTLNQMKVASVWLGKDITLNVEQDENKKMLPIKPLEIFSETHWKLLEQGICCNIPAQYSATDRSMADLMERASTDIAAIKKTHNVSDQYDGKIQFPFSSKRKRMSTIIENATGAGGYDKRLHIKGASEMVLACCNTYMNEQGQVVPLDDNTTAQVKTIIDTYAKNALRTIALAYRDLQPGEHGENHDEPHIDDESKVKHCEASNLTLIGILGIFDVIRSEVPDAVTVCHKAGIMVRMITGDNLVTAQAIAEKCRIIKQEEIGDPQVCMEGPEFYKEMGGLICTVCKLECPNECQCETSVRREKVKNFTSFKALMGKMRVMARSRPEDKYLLVTGLRNMNQVVAVTGDGTNDAPALSKADVGFGMGITGTDVCKAAADIIIMDDSFTSVVKAAQWGRNIYDNIKRFLQFQLTVNVGALIFTVIGAIFLKESPLQAIQLLWVNMIMDSLASLALATELPKPDLLDRPPQVKDDFVVSRKMTKHILYMSLFQMIVLFIFLFGGEYMIPESNVALRYNGTYRLMIDHDDSDFVFPGRLYRINGDSLYDKVIDYDVCQKECDEWENVDGASSRHMTFVFNLFIWLQIVNMIAARKIHDEVNICKGFFDNIAFLIIWVIIIVVNFLIIQYTGQFFSLHPAGQSWQQHLLAIGVSLTVLIMNMILKFLPDDVSPLLGRDSVDERRLAAKANNDGRYAAVQQA